MVVNEERFRALMTHDLDRSAMGAATVEVINCSFKVISCFYWLILIIPPPDASQQIGGVENGRSPSSTPEQAEYV